jgi:hypothetical protein
MKSIQLAKGGILELNWKTWNSRGWISSVGTPSTTGKGPSKGRWEMCWKRPPGSVFPVIGFSVTWTYLCYSCSQGKVTKQAHRLLFQTLSYHWRQWVEHHSIKSQIFPGWGFSVFIWSSWNRIHKYQLNVTVIFISTGNAGKPQACMMFYILPGYEPLPPSLFYFESN